MTFTQITWNTFDKNSHVYVSYLQLERSTLGFWFTLLDAISNFHDNRDSTKLTEPIATELDSIIPSHSTWRKIPMNGDALYARVIVVEGPTVFQSLFSGIVAHAVTDVIRSSIPWKGISATSAGWRSNFPAGPAGDVSPEWTSCGHIRRGRVIVWHPIPD